MNREEILEIIDKELKEVDIRTGKNRANAYGVKIEEYYAIEIRDEFKRLDGEYNALINLKNKILEAENELKKE
jgi:hypothetical protein